MNPPISGFDRQRFIRIYRDNFGFVRSSLSRKGVPTAALDDVAQEVFISAYAKLDTLKPEVKPRSWLAEYSRRIAANYRRKVHRYDARIEQFAQVTPATSREDAAARLIVRRFVMAILDKIPEGQRDVYVLAEAWGMTYLEVAETLDINPHTARTRLRNARTAFANIRARMAVEHERCSRDVDDKTLMAVLRDDDPEGGGEDPTRMRAGLVLLLAAMDRVDAQAAAAGSTSTGLLHSTATWAWATAAAGVLLVVGITRWETSPAEVGTLHSTPLASAPAFAPSPPEIEAVAETEPMPDMGPSLPPSRSQAEPPRSVEGRGRARSETREWRRRVLTAATEPSKFTVERLAGPVPASAPKHSPATTLSRGDSIEAGRDLLREIQTNSERGRHRDAERLIRRYRRDYPTRQWHWSFALLDLRTACALGRSGYARRRATAYRERLPSQWALLSAELSTC